MNYVAYKTAKNDINLPDGFITEHFETDQLSVPGYTVVPLAVFNGLIQNNVALIRSKEKASGIVTADPNSVVAAPRPATDAEGVPSTFTAPTTDNAALFSQFLAWIAAGKPSVPPSNT